VGRGTSVVLGLALLAGCTAGEADDRAPEPVGPSEAVVGVADRVALLGDKLRERRSDDDVVGVLVLPARVFVRVERSDGSTRALGSGPNGNVRRLSNEPYALPAGLGEFSYADVDPQLVARLLGTARKELDVPKGSRPYARVRIDPRRDVPIIEVGVMKPVLEAYPFETPTLWYDIDGTPLRDRYGR